MSHSDTPSCVDKGFCPPSLSVLLMSHYNSFNPYNNLMGLLFVWSLLKVEEFRYNVMAFTEYFLTGNLPSIHYLCFWLFAFVLFSTNLFRASHWKCKLPVDGILSPHPWSINNWNSAYTGVKWASLVAQTVKNQAAIHKTRVWSLGGENCLEKDMSTHSSFLAWRISWTEEPGGL